MEADPLDVAAQLEECERNAAIAKTLMRPQESPDEDEHGRYCLDCGETIPTARVAAVQAVRCVECAQVRERKTKRVPGTGIRRYLTKEDDS
ncbi:TraR/DksA C4-type zinc finger protein [Acidithiobacillus caldus]